MQILSEVNFVLMTKNLEERFSWNPFDHQHKKLVKGILEQERQVNSTTRMAMPKNSGTWWISSRVPSVPPIPMNSSKED
ncbi:hypothetical protein HPG69_018325 [Diceros bicornis minor]|uniref:Uncharacterized protein n=1 Tax=Diceros bicornis minor TaxID=77932 RepID=A0A7J7FGA9_DICBM|nr:hypothetical protein HPG69_018325 [Diceros bicornis minor]